MLSPDSAAVVRATLPVVGDAIEKITATFYDDMFADNPELLRDLFNRGNQANGEQRKALAGSIVAFAAMLVNHPASGQTSCSPGSRTSTSRWASPPSSTTSSTSICSRHRRGARRCRHP